MNYEKITILMTKQFNQYEPVKIELTYNRDEGLDEDLDEIMEDFEHCFGTIQNSHYPSSVVKNAIDKEIKKDQAIKEKKKPIKKAVKEDQAIEEEKKPVKKAEAIEEEKKPAKKARKGVDRKAIKEEKKPSVIISDSKKDSLLQDISDYVEAKMEKEGKKAMLTSMTDTEWEALIYNWINDMLDLKADNRMITEEHAKILQNNLRGGI